MEELALTRRAPQYVNGMLASRNREAEVGYQQKAIQAQAGKKRHIKQSS